MSERVVQSPGLRGSEPIDPAAGRTGAESVCPLCGGANACARAGGADPSPGQCWCESVSIPGEVLERIPLALRGLHCLCATCASGGRAVPDGPAADTEPDTYFTEDGRVVFTRAFHLRRGHCCGSGCRHCPF